MGDLRHCKLPFAHLIEFILSLNILKYKIFFYFFFQFNQFIAIFYTAILLQIAYYKDVHRFPLDLKVLHALPFLQFLQELELIFHLHF